MENLWGTLQFPMAVSGLQKVDSTVSLIKQLPERTSWQNKTQHAAAFVAKGDLHISFMAISLLVLMGRLFLDFVIPLNRTRQRLSDTTFTGEVRQFTPLRYVFGQCVFVTAAFVLSIVSVSHSGSWEKCLLLGYMLILCLARFVCKSSSYKCCIYHHLNTLALVATILQAIQVLLPMTAIDSPSRPRLIERAQLVLLAAVVLMAFIAPRPRQALQLDREVGVSSIKEKASPEETCSWWSYYCSYGWTTYMILRGCRRDLKMEDLPQVPSYDAPLKWLYGITAARLKGGKTFLTLCRLLKKDIRVLIFWSVGTAVSEYVAPSAMLRLLSYLEQPQEAVIHPAVWIALLFIGPMCRSLCYQQYIFNATRVLVRLNMSLVQEIYQTALRSHIYDNSEDRGEHERHTGKDQGNPSNASSKEAPRSGQSNITSLMSYDVDAIYNSRDIFYVMTAGTISVTIAMTLLYRMLGWPSLVGVFTLFLLTPLPAVLSNRVSSIQREVMRATDARLSKISEYLGSIRTLKYFGWEPAMAEKINELRSVEQKRLWKRNILVAIIAVSGDFLPMVSLLAMFSTVVLFTDIPLNAPVAFTSLSIMETLRLQFVWLSNIIRNASQGMESLRRLDHFFESAVPIKHHPAGPPEFKNATFRRTPVATFKLQDLTVRFLDGKLNVITGPTGSGKTSLLLSLLGETILEAGEATCPRDIAYVPQAAWLQNDTIRNNILFFAPYDEERYNSVIHACGLVQDIGQLPGGDQTIVGEKGQSLSGGQKQRVSLARAVYSRASTLVLDDVFSALDTHTTSAVYEGCFRSGMLQGRTVILVTHLPSALRDASLIVNLDRGAILSVRTSEEGGLLLKSSQCSVDTVVEDDSGSPPLLEPIESGSVQSTSGVLKMEDPKDTPGRLVEETSAKGRIPRTLVFRYMLLFGGYPYACLAIFVSLTVQVTYFSITYWLSIWTGSYARDEPPSNSKFYLGVYAVIVVTFLSLQFISNIIYQRGAWVAAGRLHSELATAVLSAPVSWFDQNPIGRAINRFGNDMRSLDAVLVTWLRQSADNILRFFFRLASIASIMPIFALPAAIICSIGFIIGEMYTRAQVSIKRLTAINYSPVFTHFTDTLAGMTVIRARQGMESVFQELLADKLAAHTQASEAQYNCNRWVSVRSDLCAATIAAAAGCIAYLKPGPPGLVGFSLTNAIGLSQTILVLVRTLNELEVELNSFERVKEYTQIEPEESVAEQEKSRMKSVPAGWPTSGCVEFQHVTARYHPDGPDVLKDVTFTAKPGQRIAIVGRTGSGKSTLGLSLLRFTDIVSGKVMIDGIDITEIPLHRLRTSISLIPQEPVLFSGDIRSNLDPFGQLDETDLQTALSACTAIEVPKSDDSTDNSHPHLLSLNTPVASNGENFSQGQRQVLGLARAISRRTKVVLLDEATASVDHRTDEHIQQIIRSEFPDSTIIAIAHRLRTIIDYDCVIVMGSGEILEIGSPADLIESKGVFWDMLMNTGEYDELMTKLKANGN
ncbi:hypothetical protein DTO280E4_1750 [Paecilomyces variotii]|nr:hypothetical protein DTO280E4_1750 [Paecilomyces variotii]